MAISTEIDWATGFEGLEDENSAPVQLELDGRLPIELEGILYRVGPARFSVGGRRLQHWFDGDGMIHELAVRAGHVTLRNRFVDTKAKAVEDTAGRQLFGGGFWGPPPGGPVGRLRRWRPKNVANINVLADEHGLWALWEGGHPHRIDPATLATVGPDDLGVLRPGDGFSAHPHVDPVTDELWNFGMRWGPRPTVSLYHRGRTGQWRRAFEFATPPHLVHDFAITRRFAIFVLVPLQLPFLPLGLLTGRRGYADSLRWRPRAGTSVLAVDRTTGERRTWTAPALMAFHTINAFEDGSDIVVDVAAYDDATIASALRLEALSSSMPVPHARPTRIRLLDDGRSTVDAIADVSFEMPRTASDRFGSGESTIFGVTTGADSPVLGRVAALDTRDGSLCCAETTRTIAGEPVPLVPPEGGPARFIASVGLDLERGRSSLDVYDATALEAGPVARAQLPHVVPHGLHGGWVPDGRPAPQVRFDDGLAITQNS